MAARPWALEHGPEDGQWSYGDADGVQVGSFRREWGYLSVCGSPVRSASHQSELEGKKLIGSSSRGVAVAVSIVFYESTRAQIAGQGGVGVANLLSFTGGVA